LTTQARPNWNAEMDRQIKATESAQALVNDHQATINRLRTENDKLRGAVERTIKTCQLCQVKQCTVESHKWLRASLEKAK
jgi:hypothetical protein